MLYALSFLLLTTLAVAMSNLRSRSVEDTEPTMPQPAPDTAVIRAAALARSADSAAIAAEVVTLKRHFVFAADSIEGGGWYTHKHQTVASSWNRKYLAVHVADDGRTYLSSQYTGDSWLFHTRLVVRIGDRILRSEDIPSYSNLNVRSNSGGQVWETLHFTGGQDNGILDAIAAATDTDIVRVRFEGSEHSSDIVLARRDVDALRDGRALGSALGRLEGQRH